MKKSILYLATILAFTACSKELPIEPLPPTPEPPGKTPPPPPVNPDSMKTVYLTSNGIGIEPTTVSFKIDGNTYSAKFKIRGANRPKNSYTIQLDSKAEVLGMPAGENWVLLSNFYDETLLKEDAARALSRDLGLKHNSRFRRVELVANGAYQGVYLFSEDVRRDKIEVPWIVEANGKADGKVNFTTYQQNKFTFTDPEQPNISLTGEVVRKFQMWEDMSHTGAYSTSDMGRYIDQEQVIKMMIVQELFRRKEGNLQRSVFFVPDEKGLITAGPLFDFEISAASYAESKTEGWYANLGGMVGNMFLDNRPYRKMYKQVWNDNRTKIEAITTYIQAEAITLQPYQEKNFERWKAERRKPENAFAGQVVKNSLNEEMTALITFLRTRFNFMDAEIQKF